MKRSRCELHSKLVGDLIQGNQILAVHVLNGHAEAHIRMPHFHQLFQCTISPVKAIRYSADGVIGFLEPFNADPDSDFGKLLTQLNDPVGKIAVGRNYNSVRLFIKFSDNFRDILPDKWLPPVMFVNAISGSFLMISSVISSSGLVGSRKQSHILQCALHL